jgi:hypothetical protein
MGDRYIVSLKCAGCGIKNEDIYYSPSCGFTTFTCTKCGEKNKINYCFSTSIQEKKRAVKEGKCK